MSPAGKAEIVNHVESQSKHKREVLMELGIPRSTYYRCGKDPGRGEEELPGTESLLTRNAGYWQ